MIARIFVFILIAIVLPDLYFDAKYLRHWKGLKWWKRLLWWLPCIIMTVFSMALASIKNFAPTDLNWLNLYFLLLGLVIIPKAAFALCSAVGDFFCRLQHFRKNYGNIAGLILCVLIWYVVVYGSTIGMRKLNITHNNLYFADLPEAFDGYKIVHITDLHSGTFDAIGHKMLYREIDSINAQHADLIAFTGDVQNMRPTELLPFARVLSSLKAKDGVFSVLGNHDYSKYVTGSAALKKASETRTRALERGFGWHLLLNEHNVIHRGADSLVIAGEENEGQPPFPNYSDLGKTLLGLSDSAFVVMLQHDPSAWTRDILPNSHVQLTLSGHTHGGQLSFFGIRPTHLHGECDRGLYISNNRMLYVSVGLGGLIPFRFGVSSEITIITLHKIR
jgi:predicted MPP superfamily phosphohydrolase